MTGRVNARRQGLRIERARVILRHRLCSGECCHGRRGQDNGAAETTMADNEPNTLVMESSLPAAMAEHAIGNFAVARRP